MFFLKNIFREKLNIDEFEDLLYESGVEPKFADIIIQKIKTTNSNEEDLKKLIKEELKDKFQNKKFGNFETQSKSLMVIAGNNGSGKTTFIGKFIQYFQQNDLKPSVIAVEIHGNNLEECLKTDEVRLILERGYQFVGSAVITQFFVRKDEIPLQ